MTLVGRAGVRGGEPRRVLVAGVDRIRFRPQMREHMMVAPNRELSSLGGAAVRAKAAERDSDIIIEARLYRTRHRDVTREHSTRHMAKTIASPLDMKEGTVRDRLRKHRRR